MEKQKAIFSAMFAGNPLMPWLILLIVGTIVVGVVSGFFRVRKIQPKGFKWKAFRNEIFFVLLNAALSGFLLGSLSGFLNSHGMITVNNEPTTWYVIALEYLIYFIGFDTWFYWFHRAMHKGYFYTYVHKIHHFSTSPNVLTTFSVNPLESLINGGFMPLFAAAFTVHKPTMALIGPTAAIMGVYVHCGYEFLPRWWNKSWATKWFITTTFHDQHHQYFKYNFGGYTTIWDWICGTVRPNYVGDFENPKARAIQRKTVEARTTGSKEKEMQEAILEGSNQPS